MNRVLGYFSTEVIIIAQDDWKGGSAGVGLSRHIPNIPKLGNNWDISGGTHTFL
jgi:hypothetical protein